MDAAEWKPSDAKIIKTELKIISNLKTGKKEIKEVAPFGFEFKGGRTKIYSKKGNTVVFDSGRLSLRPTFEGEKGLKGTFLESDIKESHREMILRMHLKKVIEHYLTPEEIKEHEELLSRLFD